MQRDPRGGVIEVRWAELLRRWTKDYGVSTSNLALPYLAPRGIDGFDYPERDAEKLGLRPSDVGANVLLVQPFDPVVYERSRTVDGLRLTALSQCAADLLTGSGREPSEAERLIGWMERNADGRPRALSRPHHIIRPGAHRPGRAQRVR